jgi:tetratricopeptide (TPR) repeat protein
VNDLREHAYALHQRGALAEAEQVYRAVLDRQPDDLQTLVMFGVLAAQSRKLEQAADLFERAISIDQQASTAHNNLGIVLTDLRRYQDAVASFDRAIALAPDYADAYSNRGVALGHMQRFRQALSDYDRALALQPHAASTHNNRAGVLCQVGRMHEALHSYDQAIALQPTFALAHLNRADLLLRLSRPGEALYSCDQAIAHGCDSAHAHVNRGIALKDLSQPTEALASFDRAIALDPGDLAAPYNRGRIFMHQYRFAEALADFDRCIGLQPDHAEANNAKAMCLLLLGQFEHGWRLHEWRNRRGSSFPARVLQFPRPLWLGEQSLAGKTLFIHWEQGFGDTIQFCRYARLAQQAGARVLLEVQPVLRRLLRTLSPAIEIVADLGLAAGADCHCPLLSLPLAFRTNIDTIPAEVPYLAAEPDRVARWRHRLGDGGYRIGICWQGSTGLVDAGRSFPLAMFRPLAQIPGVRLISLQTHCGTDQLQALPPDMSVETLGEDFDLGPDAFVERAAVMQHLHLIITCDTAVAHLAGALARPTWVVLKRTPDWRWLLERGDSPWYPTHRLYRQRSAGVWLGVFARLHSDLRKQLGLANR